MSSGSRGVLVMKVGKIRLSFSAGILEWGRLIPG